MSEHELVVLGKRKRMRLVQGRNWPHENKRATTASQIHEHPKAVIHAGAQRSQGVFAPFRGRHPLPAGGYQPSYLVGFGC